MSKKTKQPKKRVTEAKSGEAVASSALLGHTFELDGAILSINQEYKFGPGELWIDFQGLTAGLSAGGQCRKVEGLPIPPTALPFIKPGSSLKLKVTIVA